METGKFVHSTSEESFSSDSFETRLDAFNDGKDEYDGGSFYIGETENSGYGRKFLPIIYENIIEGMQENAYESVGEASEGWLDQLPREQLEQLELELHKTVMVWIRKTGNEPLFYKVKNIEHSSDAVYIKGKD